MAHPLPDESGVTALDAVALGTGGALALLTGAGLLLADVGHHTLAGVLGLWLVTLVTLGAALWRKRVPFKVERGPLLAAAAVVVIGGVLTIPGFSYGVADKDPGGYVAHGIEIARSGGTSFTDPALAAGLPVVRTSPGARFTGIWIRDASTGEIVPQFVHGQQALLATAWEGGGWLGLRVATPLCGLVALLGACAIGRRVAVAVLGRPAALWGALLPGLLLATDPLQVWQARTPGSEVLAQALWTSALLGVLVAVRTRWAPAAAVGGFALGAAWWVRVDAVLGLVLGLGAVAALIATRRADRRLVWAVAGCAVTLPLGIYEVYDESRTYTELNSAPTLTTLTALTVVALVAAVAIRTWAPHLGHRITFALTTPERLGRVLAGLTLLAFALLGTRRWWQGRTYHDNGRGGLVRSFDEVNVVRLSWFTTYPGMALAIAGICLVLLRRQWRASAWVVLLPGLALSAVYLVQARNSPPLMFWARRYVPTVLPFLLLMAGLAIIWLLLRHKAFGAVATALVLVFALPAAIAFRHHDEWAGSYDLSREVAHLGHGPSVFLWETGHGDRGADTLLAVPVWLEQGQLSAALVGPTRGRDAYAASFATRLHREVFIVTPGSALPAGMDASHLTKALRVDTSLPAWQETLTTRPTHSQQFPVDVTVWRWSSSG